MKERVATGRTVLLVLVIGLSVAANPATTAAQEAPFRDIEAYVEQARATWQVPGVAVAVVRGDSIVFARGFGVREAGGTALVDEHTIFAIGSSSKAFTAAALGILVDDGVLGWDDRVIDHMPWFQLHDAYMTREITIRDLLTHRSGVDQAGLLWTGSGFDRDEIVRRLRYQEGTHGFRSRFSYNNEMYLTAGQIVSEVTGKSWDRFTEERIFVPLAMSRSSTSVASLRGLPNVAAPHVLQDDRPVAIEYRKIDNVAPAGSINASALDMAQWVRLQLGEGKRGDTQILKAETVREMQTPQMVLPTSMFRATTPEARIMTYGLGWFIHEYRGRVVVEHGGAIDGMHALVGLIPDENIGIVVLTNRYPHHLPYAVMYRVFDVFLGEPETDWSSTLKAAQDAAAARAAARTTAASAADSAAAGETGRPGGGAHPTLDLKKYEGVYNSALYGTLQLSLEEGRLVLKRGDSAADLEHARHDTFRAHWRGPGLASVLGNTPILFSIGPAGAVASVNIGGFGDFTRSVR